MLNDFAEIGSEFWIDGVPDSILTERDGMYCFSGRTAIDLILQDILLKRQVKHVYMPAWCCDSMLAPFHDRSVGIQFYDVEYTGKHLDYCIDPTIRPDVLFVTNYFGFENTLPIETVMAFKEQGSIIIYDRTHSFLMADETFRQIADYCFASIRKWMGVVGGAIIDGIPQRKLKDCPYSQVKAQAMQKKSRYLQDDTTVVKQDFLDEFGSFAHSLVADYRDYAMDDLSYSIYKQMNLQQVILCRQQNAANIYENLKSVSFICELSDSVVPLFVPVLFDSKEQRDFIRRQLIAEQIYCPVHWPKPMGIPRDFAVNDIVDRELSLLCDQRYGLLQMQRQIETIIRYI